MCFTDDKMRNARRSYYKMVTLDRTPPALAVIKNSLWPRQHLGAIIEMKVGVKQMYSYE